MSRVEFNSQFADKDKVQRLRHGMPWTQDEYENLTSLYAHGATLKELCISLHRPPKGVLPKLRNLGLIEEVNGRYFRREPEDLMMPKQACQLIRAKHGTHDFYAASGFYFDGCCLSGDALTNNTCQLTPLPKEETMKPVITVTTQTLVNGRNANDLTNSEIYNLIAEQEDAIKKLAGLEEPNRPTRLNVEIEARQAGIRALVDYLNSKA